MQKVEVWIQASRPRTLITSISPVLIGTLIAAKEAPFKFSTLLFTLLTAVAIQIGTNLANDYFDFIKGADTSERKGPVRVTQAGLVSPSEIRRAFILVFSLAALLGLFLIWEGGALFALLLAVSIALGLLYTGGRYSLAYLGIGDIFVLLFFGPIATSGTYLLQTHHFSLDALYAGIGPGMLAWAILMVNNLRDVNEDRAAGKKTLCVRAGAEIGKLLYFAALFSAILTPLIWRQEHPFTLLASLIFFPAMFMAARLLKDDSPGMFNTLLKQTAGLLLLYTLLFSIGWII
ncbi:MAG: 1,4-dihydroxy-2-naphthoate polyprenyltransferase [Chlamydiales bacterium]|nr:1,4-dihydroxy-2-naphthoate polyprenyltransferase [Chlamydiales bacterium]